jgi:hypothetical protein
MPLIKKKNLDVLLFISNLYDHSWMAQSGDRPQEDLARFGYKTSRFLECFEIMLYFVTSKNLLSNFIWFEYENFQKHWHILADLVKENETSFEIFVNILFVKMKFLKMKLFFDRDLANLKGFCVFLHEYPTSYKCKSAMTIPSLK